MLILDLFPPSRFDPRGMHGAIWENFDKLPQAFVEPAAVGLVLPDMPLFLQPDRYVSVPLEATYHAAYRGVPEYYRRILDAS